MADKDEVAKAIGKEVLKGAREGGASLGGGVVGEAYSGSAKVLNELLDEVAGQQARLMLRVYRRGVGLMQGVEEYITTFYNMDPDMLRDSGIESMIQANSGGGSYRILITSPGIKARNITTVIAGEPLPPKTDRDLARAASGLPLPPGFPPLMMGQAGPGYNMGAPGAAQYFGLSGQYGPFGQQQPQSHLTDMLLMQALKPSGDTDEVKALREQVAALKEMTARAEADKARVESERKYDVQMSELKVQIEKMSAAAAAPKEDRMKEIVAALTATAPVVLAYLQSRESAQAQQLQAQQQAQQNQMNMILGLFTTQSGASKENLDMLKTMLLQPKETETDRMRGIMDIAMNSMSTTMGLTQALVNQIQAMQPSERPPWMEVFMTLIENASQMGQAALASRAQKLKEGEEPELKRIGPVEKVRALPVQAPQSVSDAASAATAAAQQDLSAPAQPPPDGMVPSDEVQVAGIEGPAGEEIELPDFSAGAFKTIFQLIQPDAQGNYVGDVHEIAFRIWKHASSGDVEALDWVRNPNDYSLIVLDALAQRGLILVTAERIQQIADAMQDLFMHFRTGGTAQQYVEKYKLDISMPRRVVVVPLPPKLEGEEDEVEADEAADGGPQEAAPPEQPKEPPVPTPSYGSGPPKMN